ncbi:MAG: glycosyltransferase family 9 protein [Proteobacteria bacterium]|nr:glycosyltransferase family 9 protein [Pseudomonadota bacterium]
MTTPSIKALHDSTTKNELHYLTQKPSNQVLEFNPYISKIIVIPTKPKLAEVLKIIKRLRSEKYDVVIDFLGLPNTAFISWLTGARKRIGFNLRGRRWFYTDALKTPKEVKYSAHGKLCLLRPLNITPIGEKITFFITDKDRKRAKEILESLHVKKNSLLISISPVSRREYKVWPADKFARLCDYINSNFNVQILFLWGPEEHHFVKAVRDKMNTIALPDYPVPSIRETVALFEKVDLHIGNDNGPMHFAISTSTPTVAIFGQTNIANWTPPGNNQHLYTEHDPGCKSSCTYPKCKVECIRDLAFEKVQKVVNQQLDALAKIPSK